MLHKETVKPGTLDLIKKLMRDQQINSFHLVGGTAMALQMGHRESIDIDLFNSGDFDSAQLADHLKTHYDARIKRQNGNYIRYYEEADHGISWQTDQVRNWRMSATNAVEALLQS